MKKGLITSIVSTLMLCIAGCAMNLMTYYMYGKMLLAWTAKGTADRIGFGLRVDPAGVLTVDLRNFVLLFLALWMFVIIILWRKSVIFKRAQENR